jgi:hypothetical protein
MTESLPTTAVVRASRATFDPSRFAEVDAVNPNTSQYLIPAVRQTFALTACQPISNRPITRLLRGS